jgi:hypothetical protein
MKNNFLKYLFIFTAIIVLGHACLKKKQFSVTPSIEYKDFIPYTDESADLKILFDDGDGDIGVSQTDSTVSLFSTYYYFDTITKKYRAFLKTSPNDTLRTNYVIRFASDPYKGKTINGEISFRIQQFRHSKKIKKIKYVIYLEDRAGNRSNTITTPELLVQ